MTQRTKKCIRCHKTFLSSTENFPVARAALAGPPPGNQIVDPAALKDECLNCYQPPPVRPPARSERNK